MNINEYNGAFETNLISKHISFERRCTKIKLDIFTEKCIHIVVNCPLFLFTFSTPQFGFWITKLRFSLKICIFRAQNREKWSKKRLHGYLQLIAIMHQYDTCHERWQMYSTVNCINCCKNSHSVVFNCKKEMFACKT